jgi:hypothetical protein
VVDTIHTNTIEGLGTSSSLTSWGTFHKLSINYLPLCVAELHFRYNNRENNAIFETAISQCQDRAANIDCSKLHLSSL